MKRKTKRLGLSICFSRAASPGKQWMSCALDHVLENLHLCGVMSPHQLPGQRGRCHHRGLSSPFSSLPHELVLSWTQVATVLAFSPFPRRTRWESDRRGGRWAVCVEYIHHLSRFKTLLGAYDQARNKSAGPPAALTGFRIARDGSATKKWPGRWPGCHRAG